MLTKFLLVADINAQDIHFSQYYSSPLNINPAQAGYFMGSYRFGLNYKNQWRSVTAPYRTFSGSFDMGLFQRNLLQDMFGAGVVFNTDKAGDADFNTTQVNLAFSYIKALNRKNNHYLSIAVQPGFSQKSVNYDKLYFDSQYNGTTHDASLPTNEYFNRYSMTYFDISMGAYWNYQLYNGLGLDAGLSVFHINKPNQSFFNEEDAVLHRKVIFFANGIFEAWQDVDMIPGIFYARQHKFSEFIFGSTFRYIKSPNPTNYTTLNLGLFFRTGDAVIVIAGFDYLNYNLGVSYDINYSGLKPASRYLGGLELSFKYILESRRSYIKKTPCPIF